MNEQRVYKLLWIIGLAAAAALNALSLVRGDLNQDEGWYLYGARLVAEGQRPYIDFATTQGPVMSYTYALANPLVARWGVAGGRLFTSVLGFGAALAAAGLAARLARSAGGGDAHAGAAHARQAALTTFFLTGVNVFQSYFTTIVKTYALASLLLLAAFGLLSCARGRRGPAAAFGAGALLMLATATRISALLALAATGLALLAARDVPRRDAWARTVAFGAGAAVAGGLVFLPFCLAAPQAFWFCLVQYHAGRTVPGLLPWLAYKAGFVARIGLAYTVAAGIGIALLAQVAGGDWRPWRRAAAAAGSPASGDARWLMGALWGSLAAVSLVHFSAPFPYDDYQAMVYPLLAVALAVALAQRARAAWVTLAVCAACLVAAGASPIVQSWFIGARDRIWWPLKARAPLAVLQDTAARVRALPGAAPGAELLTQDPYLAVETGLRVPAGMELGQFCYFPDWSDARARACHVLNAAGYRALLRTSAAPVAAFSGYGFAIRSPEVQPLPDAEHDALWQLLEARFAPAFEVAPFGQADTRLRVLTRKPGASAARAAALF